MLQVPGACRHGLPCVPGLISEWVNTNRGHGGLTLPRSSRTLLGHSSVPMPLPLGQVKTGPASPPVLVKAVCTQRG